MTFSEILSLEARNTGQITFYYEGSFWKAYEKSAFLVCEHFQNFHPSKKTVKYLGGAQIISIGIPGVTLRRLFSETEKLVDEDKRKVFNTDYTVDEAAFNAWKDAVEAKERKSDKSDPAVSPVIDGQNQVIERVRIFDLAVATPMDCMMLVMELKKMIANGHLHDP